MWQFCAHINRMLCSVWLLILAVRLRTNKLKTIGSSRHVSLAQTVTGLSPRIPGFDFYSFRAGFLLSKVALGQADLQVLLFSPVSVISPTFHSHSLIYNRRHIILAIESVVK